MNNGITIKDKIKPKNIADIKCVCCGRIYKERFNDGDEYVKCPNCSVKFFFNNINKGANK